MANSVSHHLETSSSILSFGIPMSIAICFTLASVIVDLSLLSCWYAFCCDVPVLVAYSRGVHFSSVHITFKKLVVSYFLLFPVAISQFYV